MSRRVALITGVTGQDGSYLAELLLSKGYEVHGLIRRSSTFNTSRIDHIYQDPHDTNPKLFLHYGDLIDGVGLTNLIREIKPTEVYNLGAQSHVQVSFTMPQYTGQVDAVGAVGLLEAIRSAEIDTRFYQASTSELFGSTPPPQNEESVFRPRSPYAAAKLMAYWCTVNYREGYGMHATNGILFNHESPRRGETFVTRKITRAVAEIDKILLGNLTAERDWGFAGDYVDAMSLIMHHSRADEFVVATGKKHSIGDIVEMVIKLLGITKTSSEIVQLDVGLSRPQDIKCLVGNPSKSYIELGWRPKRSFEELISDMALYDLNLQKTNN